MQKFPSEPVLKPCTVSKWLEFLDAKLKQQNFKNTKANMLENSYKPVELDRATLNEIMAVTEQWLRRVFYDKCRISVVFGFDYFTTLAYWLIPRARQDEQLALKTPFFEQLESQIGNASKYNFKRANCYLGTFDYFMVRYTMFR